MTNKQPLSPEERRSKMIEMGVVDTSITTGCRIYGKGEYQIHSDKDIEFQTYTIIDRKQSIDEDIDILGCRCCVIPIDKETMTNLGHPLRKNNVEQWILNNNTKAFLLPCSYCNKNTSYIKSSYFDFRCAECDNPISGSFIGIEKEIGNNWKDEDGKKNFNLHFQELPEENQQIIFDLLCKIYKKCEKGKPIQ